MDKQYKDYREPRSGDALVRLPVLKGWAEPAFVVLPLAHLKEINT